MVYSAADPAALPRATARLRRLLDATPNDPSLLTDVSAGLLVEAARTGTLLPALQALDAAERARRVAPADPAAAWNAALAQEFLQLPGAALETWQLALRLERDPAWRAELQQRLQRVQRQLDDSRRLMQTDSILAAGGVADSSVVQALAERMPQWRRDRGWTLLAAKATCVMQQDRACVDGTDRQLGALSAAERTTRDDSTVTWALRALDSAAWHAGGNHREALRPYVSLGEALLHYRRGAFDRAVPLLQQIRARSAGAPSAMSLWATYYLGGAEASRGRYAAAVQSFDALMRGDAAALPVLQAKAMLSRGVIDARRGNTERSLEWFRAGQARLAGVADPETSGFAAFLVSESLEINGRHLDSYAEALRALRMNVTFRTSTTLRSQVAQLARIAQEAGLTDAASSIAGETLLIARGIGSPVDIAFAFRDRARVYFSGGRASLASRDIDSATVWTARFGTGKGVDRARALIQLVRGDILRARAPRQSLEILQQALGALRGFPDELFLPEALHATARTMLVLGDTATARATLAEAMTVVEAQASMFQSSVLRASFAETAEEIFDTVIALESAQGRSAAAFEAVERSRRTAYQPRSVARAARSPSVTLSAARAELPANGVLLEYAVLADRVIWWRISRDTVRSATLRLTRDSLSRLTARARHAVEQGDEVGALQAHGLLHAQLVQPALLPADSVAPLIVVADRELFQLSFAMLHDRARGQYLVEAHDVSYAPSAAFARSVFRPRRVAAAGMRLAAVGNNAGATNLADSLPVLRAAEREALVIAMLYPRRRVLTGAAVTQRTVRAVTTAAEVMHFAGHAVFDEAHPEQSYLLLTGVGDAARWRAEDIATLQTSRLRLVVLSACRTLNARAGRVGPVSGLAYSFLQTGASGTVSSLWDVNDGEAVDFMAALHRYLVQGYAPAAALRQVQREFLRSPIPARRSPRQWAGFTLTGR